MKIDTEVIKEVMFNMDEYAQEDPEFLQTVELFIFQLEQLQTKKNVKPRNKS